MGRIGWADNPLAEITVRRSKQARRMTLRVSNLDGQVTLTVPPDVSERMARGFVADKADWIAKARGGVAEVHRVAIGQKLLVEGLTLDVVAGVSRKAVISADRLEAPTVDTARAVKVALQDLARRRIETTAARYCATLGVSMGRITLRDTRSRWGSCSHQGNLMLSWRLIMAPPEVLDYVVAHEVAHLKEMNHSAAFWALVAGLCPDYRQHKTWLRRNGAALHRYRFD